MAEKKRRVQLTFPWTAPDGTAHEGGATIELPDLRARQLIRAGRARAVEETTQAPPEAPSIDAPAQEPAQGATGPEEAAPAPAETSTPAEVEPPAATATAPAPADNPSPAPQAAPTAPASTRKGR